MCFVFEICSLPETFTCIEWAANLFVILSSNVWIICQFHSQPVFTEIIFAIFFTMMPDMFQNLCCLKEKCWSVIFVMIIVIIYLWIDIVLFVRSTFNSVGTDTLEGVFPKFCFDLPCWMNWSAVNSIQYMLSYIDQIANEIIILPSTFFSVLNWSALRPRPSFLQSGRKCCDYYH